MSQINFNKDRILGEDVWIESLNFGLSLIGVPYEWWGGGDCESKAPMWAENGTVPNKDEIISCNCAGLTNLILRFSKKKIPHTEFNGMGGTGAYANYYKDVYNKFDINIKYPIGTLIIRDFRDIDDQGHVAIIIENNGSQSKVLQSFTFKNKYPGVNINYTLDESNKCDNIGTNYYEFAVLPEHWLK